MRWLLKPLMQPLLALKDVISIDFKLLKRWTRLTFNGPAAPGSRHADTPGEAPCVSHVAPHYALVTPPPDHRGEFALAWHPAGLRAAPLADRAASREPRDAGVA